MDPQFGAVNPQLSAELGGRAPAALGRLSTSDQERLAATLKRARQRQDAALERAVDEGLAFLPRLVRVAVNKLLF